MNKKEEQDTAECLVDIRGKFLVRKHLPETNPSSSLAESGQQIHHHNQTLRQSSGWKQGLQLTQVVVILWFP